VFSRAFNKIRQRGRRRSVKLGLLAALAVAALGIAIAAAATTVPVPTITSQPANPTNQTSAHFTYTDSQAGVTFLCSLDGGTFSGCASTGITYSGPLAEGGHAFKVEAVAPNGKVSAAAVYKWTIDAAPPTVALAFPKDGTTYGESKWAAGCSPTAGICGSAKDPSGVKSVLISIRKGNGSWWGGSSFNQTSENFIPTTLASPGAGSSAWSYAFAFPAEGSYTVHVRASDSLGNTTPAGSQISATFTIDVPPPTPVISSGPELDTTSTTATFVFSDSEAGVTLLCRLDGGSFASCTSPKTYTALSSGAHTFYVEAKDPVGNVSSASYSWTVETSHKAFTIVGSISGPLAPGVSQPLPLTISNPNTSTIYVTGLLVSVRAGSTKEGCDGPTNLQVTQSSASGQNTLAVPANGSVTLPAGSVTAPQVLMKDLASNQDACKGASFTFNYSGSAHS
jgi:hypothetical protein